MFSLEHGILLKVVTTVPANLHDVVDSISSLSKISPTFGQIGGGVQFELPDNVSCLIKNGFLKEIFW